MKTIKLILLVGLLATISFQSCKKDDPGVAPDLPPETSFVPDFSDFESSKAMLDTTSVNWGHSAGNVFIWNVIIHVSLAIPVASYIEAVKNHEAVYQSDNTWLWEYSFTAGSNTFKAKLFGTIKEGTVEWEMYITKSGEYEDFLWYTGVSQLDGSSVDWILYESPTQPNELLSIDWNRTTDNTANIKFLNIKPGGAENGGYIFYGNDSNSDLNAYYDIYNKGQDNLIEIEWSQTNKNGRVKDERKFGDTEWHCWDENLKDMDCN